ncbi:MAG: hypothetical protein ACK4XJ_08480 [Fimbriimonadaceae bacterium]
MTQFNLDKPVGILISIAAAFGAMNGFFLGAIGGVFGRLGQSASEVNPGTGAVFGIAGLALATVGVVIGVFCLVLMVCGFGVIASRRWAFMLAIVLGLLVILLGFGGGAHLSGLVSLGILGYCALRLTGTVGPRPTT